LKIVGFLLQNTLPFGLVEEFLGFIKEIVSRYESEDITDLSMSKTTASKVARECISTSLKETITQDLKCFPFSLSIDESSDTFGDAYLAITAS